MTHEPSDENKAWLARLVKENARRLRLMELGASKRLILQLDEIRARGTAEHYEELRETYRRLERLIPLR